MARPVKHIVSKDKRRYIDEPNGFDLDLAYIIPDRIVAMGFPSEEGLERYYRNPMTEVQRFLEFKHKDHYKIYNLCSERSYDHAKFHDSVARYPFEDHNCPNFELITTFCVDVTAWLGADPKNVAIIHCKAGKGRTGLMICCWLLHSGEWSTADEAMQFYGAMRTIDKKGVTIPSQIRYVRYFEQMMRYGMPKAEPLFLSRIIFHGQPNISELRFTVSKLASSGVNVPLFHSGKIRLKDVQEQQKKEKDKEKDKEKKKKGSKIKAKQQSFALECNNVPLCGDIKVEFEKLMHFWINTSFITGNSTVIKKSEIDKANKDKKDKIFPGDFRLELVFKNQADFLGSQNGGLSVLASRALSSTTANMSRDASRRAVVDGIMRKYPSLMNL